MASKPIAFAVVALLVGCGSVASEHRKNAARYVRASEPGQAIKELRKAVALNARDRESHAQLGLLEFKMGREGAAIVHLDRAHQLGLRAHSKLLAQLLHQRARQRQKLGHSERWQDLARARKLSPKLAAVIRQPLAEALVEAGLRRWFAGDRGAADKLWRRVPKSKAAAVDRHRRVLAGPEKATLAHLRQTIVLVRRVVGERAARPLHNVYESRGGPLLPPAPCPDATVVEVGHRGCAPLLRRLVAASLMAPPAVRLELRSASPVPPEVVADVVVLSLSQWLWGQRDDWFDAELRAFVLRETRAQAVQARLAWLAPTVKRLRGSSAAAPDALAAGQPRVRLLRAMELALRGRTERARALLAGIKLPLANVAKATIARGGSPAGRDLTAWASDRLRLSWLRFAHIAPKFSPTAMSLLSATEVAASASTEGKKRLGTLARKRLASRPGCADANGKRWSGAQDSYFAAVEVGAQHVEDIVAEEPSRFCRGADAADFFVWQGDFARAQHTAQTLLLEDPTVPHGLLIALRAFARGDNVPRAQQILQDAEYWSGRRGAPSLFAAKTFLHAAKPVPALRAARAALALGEGVTRWDAFELIIVAALQLERERDAVRAFDAYLADLPKRLRDDAARRVADTLARHGVSRPSWVGPVKAAPGLLSAQRSAALSPWAVGPRIKLIARAKNKTRLALELLLIGLSVEGERGARALEAFAKVADGKGQFALASAARKEATLIR